MAATGQPTGSGLHILVTGSAAHLARPLLPLLCADARIAKVIGVDVRASGFAHTKYREHHIDVRASELAARMRGIDALIHLAFVVLPAHNQGVRCERGVMQDINLRGSANVFTLARAAGVRRIVHISSAVVYGAWPENAAALSESAPRRAMAGFAYAEDKVAVEDWLDAFEASSGQPSVVRLRPHVILGPHAQPLLRWLLRQPCYPRLPDPQPLTQCVWEDDVARAIVAAVHSQATGAFNLAADPPLSFRDMQRARHRLAVPLPYRAASWLHRALWRVSPAVGEPAWLEGMRYSLAVDSRRARSELGWQPMKNSYQCLRALN